MKPKPASSMHRATAPGARSMRAPSASRTSALPDSPVAERLPCLARAQPAPAAIRAAVVETLNGGRPPPAPRGMRPGVVETLTVGRPPPVPAVSTRSWRSHGTGVARARIVLARPASSSTVSPFVRRAMRKAAICASDALPAMISASTADASSWARSWPDASASMARVRTSLLKEVLQQQLAVMREHRLGVELDALGWELAVAQGHHDAAPAGRHLEAVRDACVVHDERVIAPHGQRRGQAGEDRAPVVLDGRRLAVNGHVTHDATAEGLRHRLMAEAHAQGRHAGLREAAGDLDRHAGLVGRARPGRDDDPLEAALEQLVDARAVVAHDLELAPQLAQVLDEVVGERVVVVDHEDLHGQSGCSIAISTARSTPLALASDSRNSYSGLASATVPPPAWTWPTPSLMTTVRMWMQVSRSPV